MKRNVIDASMENVKKIISNWNHKTKRKYWNTGYYTFIVNGDESFIRDKLRLFFWRVMKENMYVINLFEDGVEKNGIFFHKYIIIKEYDFWTGKMIITHADEKDDFIETELSVDNYLDINKTINGNRIFACNIVKYY